MSTLQHTASFPGPPKSEYVDPTVLRPDRNYALLGLSQRDIANLHLLREHDPQIQNLAVLIRRLVEREATRLRNEPSPTQLRLATG